MEPQLGEPLDPAADEQADDDPDRDRDEDEHGRPVSAPSREDVVQLRDVVFGVAGDEPVQDGSSRHLPEPRMHSDPIPFDFGQRRADAPARRGARHRRDGTARAAASGDRDR